MLQLVVVLLASDGATGHDSCEQALDSNVTYEICEVWRESERHERNKSLSSKTVRFEPFYDLLSVVLS